MAKRVEDATYGLEMQKFFIIQVNDCDGYQQKTSVIY